MQLMTCDEPQRTAASATPRPRRQTVARQRRIAVYTRRIDATYRVHVSDAYPTEAANEWAHLVRRITDRPGWSVARLARDSGIHRSTIFRWIRGDVQNLTLDSIRLVAEAGEVDFLEALRVAATLVAPDAAQRLERDEGEQIILNSNATVAQKKMMLDRYHRKLEEIRHAALEDLREQVELLRRHDVS